MNCSSSTSKDVEKTPTLTGMKGLRWWQTFVVFLMLSFTGAGLTYANAEQPDAQKINLALRRTADKLLRASGDYTSRIPAVEHTSANVWRIQIRQTLAYDTLPAILQSSLDQYGIPQSYEVAVRRCEDDVIDLGYHQKDFAQDSTVPCLGREEPDGCHYIEITFTGPAVTKAASSWKYILIATIFLAAIVLGWWFFRKPSTPQTDQASDGDWISFGQSRLHLTSQILECEGIRHQLTYREAKLLRLFAAHPGQLLEREQIMQQVWADEGVQVGRSVDMFVSRLRKKLKADATVGIVAVHGVGYKLEIGIGAS